MVVSVKAALFREMTQCSLLEFCRRLEERVFSVFIIEARMGTGGFFNII
jgi:hypothetical protein